MLDKFSVERSACECGVCVCVCVFVCVGVGGASPWHVLCVHVCVASVCAFLVCCVSFFESRNTLSNAAACTSRLMKAMRSNPCFAKTCLWFSVLFLVRFFCVVC